VITRRQLIQTAALLPAALQAKPFRRDLGAQLYTVRKMIPKDPDGVLRRIAELGYREVQMNRRDLTKLRPIASGVGLRVTSVHIETWLLTGKKDVWTKLAGPQDDITLETAIDSIAGAGLKSAVLAYLMPGAERGNADYYKQLAEKMNRMGERFAKDGIQFGYHNHAFEFEGNPGERPIDILLAGWDPKLVKLQADVFWLSVAGQDPAAFIDKHADRIAWLHLKDKLKGAPVSYKEQIPPETFKECGAGSIDFSAVLKASAKADVKSMYVEQDESGDPLESLAQSIKYLRTVNV
jgi:sugar phosphate isomerase/epimerase